MPPPPPTAPEMIWSREIAFTAVTLNSQEATPSLPMVC